MSAVCWCAWKQSKFRTSRSLNRRKSKERSRRKGKGFSECNLHKQHTLTQPAATKTQGETQAQSQPQPTLRYQAYRYVLLVAHVTSEARMAGQRIIARKGCNSTKGCHNSTHSHTRTERREREWQALRSQARTTGSARMYLGVPVRMRPPPDSLSAQWRRRGECRPRRTSCLPHNGDRLLV